MTRILISHNRIWKVLVSYEHNNYDLDLSSYLDRNLNYFIETILICLSTITCTEL